ncbi:Protein kinase family protein [Euphorbia peplus]|nr:Protein kinase family protein [Euphorbia peplus]
MLTFPGAGSASGKPPSIRVSADHALASTEVLFPAKKIKGAKMSFTVAIRKRCRRLGYRIRCLADQEIEQLLNKRDTEFIGKFQFGDVYVETYEDKNVVVKIWKELKLPEEEKEGRSEDEFFWRGTWENEGRLEDECILHDYFSFYEFNPNIAKMQYFCRGPKHVAAIYYVEPKAINTLHNLIEKDDFTWVQRIKVAFGFASLLHYMHTPHPKCPSNLPYLMCNIDAAHILVDQDYEALLFDFIMISGGVLTDKRELLNQKIYGCSGYSDPSCAQPGKFSDACDGFSYGVVLSSLISKKVYKDDSEVEPNVYLWAKDNHERHNSVARGNKHKLHNSAARGNKQNFGNSAARGNKHNLHNSIARGSMFSLVDDSLKSEPEYYFDDAVGITNLAMKCVKSNPDKRPTMKEIVTLMQNLLIVKENRDTWECCRMLDEVNEIFQSEHLLKDDRGTYFLVNDDILCGWYWEVKWQPSIWHWSLSRKHRMHKYMNQMQEYKHQRPKFKNLDQSPESSEYAIGKDNVIKVFDSKVLIKVTDKFSNENLMGKFLFGKLFRGETEEENKK